MIHLKRKPFYVWNIALAAAEMVWAHDGISVSLSNIELGRV